MEVSRKGSLLEKTLADIFNKAGFDVEINSRKFGFETDVLITKGNFKIIVEAKQYENSYINVGSLLHEWHSKGKSVDADRVLVVITGVKKINKKFFQLAEELGIYLWDEDTLHELIGIEGNRKLCRQICSHLEFGDVMKRFEKIENSNLSTNQIYNLQNQAIALDDLEFQKELSKSIKEKKEKEKLIEEQQRIFEDSLRKAKKKAKIFKWIKISLILAISLFLVLFFYFKIQNVTNQDNQISDNNLNNVINNSQQEESMNYSEQILSPKEELINFCISEFSAEGIFDLKKTTYLGDYASASNWIEDNYENSALSKEQKETNINYIINNQLPKEGYPIIITLGSEKEGQVTSQGFYYCNENGVI